jgi:hypothetical protein
MISTRITFLLTLSMVGLVPWQPGAAEDNPPVFETDIRPILADKCGKCHSEKTHKGGLDLSSIQGVRKGGESGESAVAESVDDSMLWIMIDGESMPPEGNTSLSEKERELIRSWIAGGAKAETAAELSERPLNQHDVLPIVLLRCVTCHGAQRRDGGLDLRTPEKMQKGGKHGPALVAGDADASLMIQRIESEACPPRELLLKFFVKRPGSSDVEVLRRWINAGAPMIDLPPDVPTTEPDPLVTDEDRQHWAFQPPQVASSAGSIDEFILKQLEKQGFGFSPEADRDTLIRRAYLDLVGIPPSIEEWKTWRDSEDPDWYSAMIDHLLASPRYGERWGRYWLDVAGYADSEGGISADPVREVAWKYRDYVIRAFNEDKPYDRFLLEQIAGDELVDYENAPVITEEIVDNLVATGFLRMGIDQTGSRTMNFVPERLGVIGDAINVLGSGVMGLTLECARCHSHKYDPIPHRDYYRFKAIFQGALDEHDWLTFKNRSLEVATPEQRQRFSQKNPPLRTKLKKLEANLKVAVAEVQSEMLRQHYPDQSEADRQETLRALRIADNNRTLPQRLLVENLQTVELIPPSEQPAPVQKAQAAVRTIENEILQLKREMEPPLEIRALWDRGEPSPTYLLRRGDHDKPGPLVGPSVPSVLTDGRTPFAAQPPFPDGTPKTGRRLAFARWLVNPDHPLTARVMVNRIWYHHFGTGIVKTLENFGVQGEPPSHPELLDWLAREFSEQGWSIKEMHRLMMNSRTYKQSSRVAEELRTIDPNNRLLSRMPLNRMNAEALRDSLLFVSGKLDEMPYGPPDRVTVDHNGLVTENATTTGGWRRSIYLQYRRTEIPTMMETFDYPEMGPNCVTRSVSIVSPQSLMLMNNEHVHNLAVAFADRVEKLKQDHDPGSLVDTVYQVALTRPPSEQERRLGIETLKELETTWNGDPQKALETYCHTILNSAAFLYID